MALTTFYGVAQTTKYLDKNFMIVEREKGFYYRVLPSKKKNKQKLNGEVITYHLNGEILAKDMYQKGSKNGESQIFFPTGKIALKGMYKDNKPIGEWTFWYPNGQKRAVGVCSEETESMAMFSILSVASHPCKVMQFWYTTGEQLIKDGKGYYTAWNDDLKIAEEGNIADGLKQGQWKGYQKDGKIYYKEVYKKGKLAFGESYDKEGNTYQYKKIITGGKPQNGLTEFYKFVGEELKYPKAARQKNIQGRVIIKTVINNMGKIENVQVIRNVHPLLDAEAIRVVKAFEGTWLLTKTRGQIEEKNFWVMPIIFRLS